MEQPQHHRREPFLVLMSLACLLALTSCLQSSFYLQRHLGASSTTEAGVSSFENVALFSQSTPDQRFLQHFDAEMKERSRDIDSSHTNNNAVVITTASSKPIKKTLDFVIAGFPKTGTTSLLYAFGDHRETDIATKERCAITNPMASDYVAFGKLQEALSELSGSPRVKRGIKCPNAVYHAYSAIVRLEQHAPDTKFVIGVRHPVDMLQSYYNYRVTELYDKYRQSVNGNNGKLKKMEGIPPLDRLIGMEKEWKGVSTDSTRFELYLMQFGKTKVEANELQDMVNTGTSRAEKKQRHLAIKPNSFSIFLYTVDQLEDTDNAERSKVFRSGLQNFLGLERPLKPVGRENLNHFVGKKAHRETVDICLPKYNPLRRVLVQQGARSADWIESEFLKSPDVVVANREHFVQSIRLWSKDPCENRRAKNKKRKKALPSHGHRARRMDDAPNDEKERKRVFVGKHRKIEVIPVKL